MLLFDTGVCPRCGSLWTGRVIEKTSDAKRFALMGPVIYTSDPGNLNCGCVDCGVMWSAPLKMKWVPIGRYIEMQKAWWTTVDDSPSHTPAEEAEIAETLYNDMLGTERPSKKKRFAFIRKIISYEGKLLKKQASTVVADFAGVLRIRTSEDDNDELDGFTGYKDEFSDDINSEDN